MRSFRTSLISQLVAWTLVLLGASPVTAPFSTFQPGDAAPSTQSAAHKLLDHCKVAQDKLVAADDAAALLLPIRVEFLRMPDAPHQAARIQCRHDVLRI